MFLRVDNFAAVSVSKACVSKSFQILSKMYKTWILVYLNIVCLIYLSQVYIFFLDKIWNLLT